MAASQQQASSQALDPEWITLALEKFSFAVSPVRAVVHQWVHDTRRDELFLVFRPSQLPSGEGRFEKKVLMSVLAGGQLLERSDVGKLVAIAEDYDNRLRNGLVDPSLEAPVHIVVKSPCIAMRYEASSATVRRIQMKFKNENDYQKALEIFQNFNFPMRNATYKGDPPAPMRPLRPASTSIVPHQRVSFPDLPNQGLQPLNSYHAIALDRPSSVSYPQSARYSVQQSPFFKRPQTASSDSARPGSSWSLGSGRLSDTISSTSHGTLSAKPSFTKQTLLPEYSIFASQVEKESQLPTAGNSNRHEDWLSISDKAPVVIGDNLFSRIGATHNAPDSLPPNSEDDCLNRNGFGPRSGRAQNGRATSAFEKTITQSNGVESYSDRQAFLISDSLRPVSAPIHKMQDNYTQWLPPRRELPFPKPRATVKAQDNIPDTSTTPNSQSLADEAPTESALNRTPKNFISVQHQTAAVPACNNKGSIADSRSNHIAEVNRRNSIRQSGFEPTEEQSPLAAKSATATRPVSAQGLQSKLMTTKSRKRPSSTPLEAAPAPKQARKMVDRATQTQTLSGRDHTAPQSMGACNERAPPMATNDTNVQSVPGSFMNEIDEFVSKYKNRPAPKEIWQKPGYAEASPEERQAIINDFICENLDNEDFIKLCEDTGEVWRRIGLEI